MAEIKTVVGSKAGALNWIDWKKGFIGLGMAMIGAALAFITDWLLVLTTGGSLGMWALPIAAAWSYVANMIRKWITDNSNVTTKTATTN